MDNLEVEKECMKYLEKIVGNLNDDKLTLWGHKHMLKVEDADIFHKIVQATGNNKIRDMPGGLCYIVDVPIGSGNIVAHWTVGLDNEENNNFLNKYRKEYTIN